MRRLLLVKRNLFLLLLLLLLPGCGLVEAAGLPAFLSSPTATAALGATAGPTPSRTPAAPSAAQTPAATSTGAAESPSSGRVDKLILWLPPEFDPYNDSPAGDLLRERLALFSQQNGGVKIEVRVKAASGPGGLLDSLSAASAAAPRALPSVVALSRADLEAAAIKGLLIPLDGISTAIDETDWYDYARQLAMVQGATYALPFAGDALVLAYRPASVFAPPVDWPAINRLAQPLGFPAGDGQALFVLTLYQSIGGTVEDAQRRPTLQPDRLSQVLQILADGEERGIFPVWLSQYETSGQVWQAYRDQRVNALVTWVSNYLTSLPPDTIAVPLPALDDSPLTLATGWGWAVADPDPARRELSARLVEFLADGNFLAGWTEASGSLPTRPSSLAAWSNQSLKTLLSPVAVSAQARPSSDLLASLGPVLEEATLKVLQGESDPTQAAQAAAERLAVPEAR